MTNRLSDYCKGRGIPSEEQSGFRLQHSQSTCYSLETPAPGTGTTREHERCLCASSTSRRPATRLPENCCGRHLARTSVPDEMIAGIRQLHDRMLARVRMDDGTFSDWFEVTQRLRQGCVPRHHCYTTYSCCSTLDVALERISKDDPILLLRKLVHFEAQQERVRKMKRPLWSACRGRFGECCTLATQASSRDRPQD